MKQLCSPRRRAEHVKLFLYIIALAVIPLILASCFNKPAAPPPAATNVDRTEGGNAPGQITMEPAQSIPGRAIQKAIGEKCKENLRQLRMMIRSEMDTNGGTPPASLASLNLHGEFPTSCPIGHEQYVYTPETGLLKCPHPGHEDF